MSSTFEVVDVVPIGLTAWLERPTLAVLLAFLSIGLLLSSQQLLELLKAPIHILRILVHCVDVFVELVLASKLSDFQQLFL